MGIICDNFKLDNNSPPSCVFVCTCACVCMCVFVLRLKRIQILVFKYSFGFKTNSPNILLIIKSN